MATLGQKFKKYDKDFRLKIIKECTKFGVIFISKKYDINSRTVRSWINNYKKGILNINKGRISAKDDYKERYEIQKKFMTFLKQERQNVQNLFEKINQDEQLKIYYQNSIFQKQHITDKDKK